MAAEVVMACVNGAVATAWALYLGCDAFLIGVIGALPFLARLMQFPGAYLTSRLGSRLAALITVARSRQALLPLIVLPFVPLSPEAKRGVLVAVAVLHHGLGILCNNAWVTWMGGLVPPAVRGRYFGRRTGISTCAGGLTALTTALVLDAIVRYVRERDGRPAESRIDIRVDGGGRESCGSEGSIAEGGLA